MIREFYFFTLLVALVAVCDKSLAQTQAPSADNWVDYVAGEYDIQPNITYATANNTELKIDLIDGPNAKHYALEWFGSMSNRQELARQLSPIPYVRAGLPPIITIHGSEDNIVPYNQAVRLHAALDKAGVPNQLVTIRGAGHGGFNRETMVNSFAAIREFLRKQKVL